MKFYNRYYTGSYEELLTYYPRFYRDVFEMVEILKAFGRVADGLEAGVERVFLNSFILTADAETVKEWEGILHITYAEQLTLDQRKRIVIGRLCGNGHIGEQEIREIIANYTGGAVGIDFKLGVIYITIEGEVFGEANLLDTLYRRVPAHLAIGMQVRTRRTFRQQLRSCSAMNAAVHTAATQQRLVGSVDDGVHLHFRDVISDYMKRH